MILNFWSGLFLVVGGKCLVHFEWWLRKKLYPTSAIKWLCKELDELNHTP